MGRVLHTETWQPHHNYVDKPQAQFSGQVSLEQLQDDLDFCNEQPVGSSLYQTKPWPLLFYDTHESCLKTSTNAIWVNATQKGST